MEKIRQGIKLLLFHPGIWLSSIATFFIFAGLLGTTYSLSMFSVVQQRFVYAFSPQPTRVPVISPSLSLAPSLTPTPSQVSFLALAATDMPKPELTIIPTPTVSQTVNPQDDGVWNQLAQCESNGHWQDDTGNGYYGGLQFSLGAWASVGGGGKPSDASKDEQIMRGKMLQANRGWAPWGACSKKLGLY